MRPGDLQKAFLCIYKHENGGYGWQANTGNGYYGGLQMDRTFQKAYGGEFYRMWGTADNWPAHVQLVVAYRAYYTRGFYPWPNTARYCGLI
jgi:resuscitation-promoting factor RpfA